MSRPLEYVAVGNTGLAVLGPEGMRHGHLTLSKLLDRLQRAPEQLRRLPTADVVRQTAEALTPAAAADPVLARYKDLTALHYSGELTPEQSQELAAVERELDATDAKDPHLQEFVSALHTDYDELETGLQRVRSILDELIRS
ncbi:MAG: hypothetical protein H0X73_06360 [Chthoniobacterales bacterium]|nr:hypothetical protein [Chthoniobacterales bacterium]